MNGFLCFYIAFYHKTKWARIDAKIRTFQCKKNVGNTVDKN